MFRMTCGLFHIPVDDINPLSTRTYHAYGYRKLENFQVMNFFKNEGLQYGVLQLMCHNLFFTQITPAPGAGAVESRGGTGDYYLIHSRDGFQTF